MKINLNTEKYVGLIMEDKNTLYRTEQDYQIFKKGDSLVFMDIWQSLKYFNKVDVFANLNESEMVLFYQNESFRNQILATPNREILEHKFIGMIIDSQMDDNCVLANLNTFHTSYMFCMKPDLKKQIEISDLSGIIFYPCWIRTYRPNENPDYWLGMPTNQIGINLIQEYRSGLEYPKSMYSQILKDEYLDNLKDFNYLLPADPKQEYNLVADLGGYPNVISQKAYQIMKDFKGLSFYPINTVSRRLDLEDTIEIIK